MGVGMNAGYSHRRDMRPCGMAEAYGTGRGELRAVGTVEDTHGGRAERDLGDHFGQCCFEEGEVRGMKRS